MSDVIPVKSPEPVVVRYWASARAAAGVAHDTLPTQRHITLAELLDRVRALHADRPRLAEVMRVCSVLVGGQPVGLRDHGEVVVQPGDTVELLPPFAGG